MSVMLKGITWNHSRGFASIVAASQRFTELHPGVELVWTKRSLQEFADAPLDRLAQAYDLIVIDHPWAGYAVEQRLLLPLEKYIPEQVLADQAAHSTGHSHASYAYGAFQSALAIDAATPVASYRPDLLDRRGLAVPRTWDEVLELARRSLVVFPAIGIDSLMNFYMFCVSLGEEPFADSDTIVSRETGVEALNLLRQLASYCPEAVFTWNPIAVYEAMSNGDDFAYCPFAYGYSNYARVGYSRHTLKFDDLVHFRDHGKLRSVLGGTGLAVSARCGYVEEAAAFVRYAASPQCQSTIYTDAGGQPAHRLAWLDEETNRRTNRFFKDTLPALDRAYVRPRYSGYMHLQDHAGELVKTYMADGGDPGDVLDGINRLYRESRREVKS